MDRVDISVPVPVLNEEEFSGTQRAAEQDFRATGRTYEIIYINDGSTDGTQQMLEEFHSQDKHVKVVEFNRNYGQHMALFAAMERSRGDMAITIDADLQNPPEEIPKLVAKIDEGYEVVGTYRKERKDSIFRTLPSYIVNKITARLVGEAARLGMYAPGLQQGHCRLHEHVRRVGRALSPRWPPPLRERLLKSRYGMRPEKRARRSIASSVSCTSTST